MISSGTENLDQMLRDSSRNPNTVGLVQRMVRSEERVSLAEMAGQGTVDKVLQEPKKTR
jgi:hypothetical protein